MIAGQTALALIPARAGSKGLPGKNIRSMAGKPLIAWTIEAAKQSRRIDRVVVTTDGSEIAAVAKSFGADVPFVRPAEFASDEASSAGVIRHALEWLAGNEGYVPGVIVLLQPTSPLRTAADIDMAADVLDRRNGKAVVSVCPVEHHPWLANTLPADDCMSGFLRPEAGNVRRQDMPDFYRLNGAIYMASLEYYTAQGGFYGPVTYAYKMALERSVDIDTMFDFRMAELILAEAG